MNWKGTLALVLVSGGLGAYAYFVESKKDAPPPAGSLEVKLWDLKDDASVQRVVVEDDQGKKAEYARKTEAEGWRYVPRATHSLDAVNWDSPYGNLVTLMADRKVEDAPKSLKDYGLEKPSLKVLLGDEKNPERHKVLVGTRTSLNSSAYYVQVDDDKTVYQVGSWKVEGWQKLLSTPPVGSPAPTPTPATSVSTPSATNPPATP